MEGTIALGGTQHPVTDKWHPLITIEIILEDEKRVVNFVADVGYDTKEQVGAAASLFERLLFESRRYGRKEYPDGEDIK